MFLAHSFGASWLRGEKPGINEALPYGYYHAAEYGCVVKYSIDAIENPVTHFIRLVARWLIGFDLLHAWRNRRDLSDADVVWTHSELEHLAVVALWSLMPPKRRPRLIAQCIWIFDKWNRLPAFKRRLYTWLLSQTDVMTAQSSEGLKFARRYLSTVPCRINRFGTHKDGLIPAVLRPVHTPLRILSLGRDMHRDWATVMTAVSGWDGCEARIGAPLMTRSLAWVKKNVEFVNPDNAQLRNLYDWADIVVVALKPNLHASGVTVVAESVLMGVPLICSDVGGMRDYFSGDEITYVQPGDPEAIRRAITHLAGDDALRLSMVRKAQQHLIQTDLSTRARARRMAEMSRELLGERTAAKQPSERGHQLMSNFGR